MALTALLQRALVEAPRATALLVTLGHPRRVAVLRRRRDHAGDLGALGGRGARGRRAEPRARWSLPITRRRADRAVRDPALRHAPRRRALRAGDGGLVRRDRRLSALHRDRPRTRRSSRRCRRPTARSSSSTTAPSRSSRSASVVLAVTGAEALYADMGHFGRRPIRRAWFCARVPGADAQLPRPGLADPAHRPAARCRTRSSCSLPGWAQIPMVVLATVGDGHRLAGGHLRAPSA